MAKGDHKWCKSCKNSECDGNYFPAICEDCKWRGCSNDLGLTRYQAGDADVYCPKCGSENIDEDNDE